MTRTNIATVEGVRVKVRVYWKDLKWFEHVEKMKEKRLNKILRESDG